MVKVLYICPSSGVGAAETFLIQTQKYADKENFENHYLLFRSGPLLDSLQGLGAHVHLLNTPPRLSSRSDRKMVHNKIKDLINGYNIDLVHSTMAYGTLFAAWTCRQMQIPLVWFQHGPVSGWMDRAAALLYHQGLIVNSHFTGNAQRALENPIRFLIPRNHPIEKILLGTPVVEWDASQIEAEKNRWLAASGAEPQSLGIAILCQLQTWKGVHILLDAIHELKNEKDLPPFQAVVWGESYKGQEYLQSLKQQVHEQSLPVHFAGHTNNSSLSLASCQIVVIASVEPESFGMSIIEGMMVGTVPVAPDEGGPLEVISNGKNGLLFKARQKASLARQLKTLLKDPELLRSLSVAGKETARQKYTAERAITHLESFHRKILGA